MSRWSSVRDLDDLRHSFASIWAERAPSSVRNTWMGHSSIFRGISSKKGRDHKWLPPFHLLVAGAGLEPATSEL